MRQSIAHREGKSKPRPGAETKGSRRGQSTAAAQTVKKASQSLRSQAQRKWKSFSPAACTSEKIPLGSQTCEGRALRAMPRAAALSNESPVKRVSFESLSKILFLTSSAAAARRPQRLRIIASYLGFCCPYASFFSNSFATFSSSWRMGRCCGQTDSHLPHFTQSEAL